MFLEPLVKMQEVESGCVTSIAFTAINLQHPLAHTSHGAGHNALRERRAQKDCIPNIGIKYRLTHCWRLSNDLNTNNDEEKPLCVRLGN